MSQKDPFAQTPDQPVEQDTTGQTQQQGPPEAQPQPEPQSQPEPQYATAGAPSGYQDSAGTFAGTYPPATTQPGYGGYGGGGYGGGYPSAYDSSGYGYAPAQPRTDDRAVWALVASIAGYVLLPIVLHIVGWVLANQSLSSIRASRGALTGDGIARTARVLGIVGVVLYGIGALIALVVFAVLVPLGFLALGTASSVEFADETIAPVTITDVDGEVFEHGGGTVVYDLTDLDFAEQDVDMGVDLGIGSLTVEVPDDVTVVLDAEVGAGAIDAFGQRTDGVTVSRDRTYEGTGSGTLDLRLDVTFGEITVTRG